jgi:hypothetical protein
MTPIDHASDVVSLLATTSTNGAGESPPHKILRFFGSGGISDLRCQPA